MKRSFLLFVLSFALAANAQQNNISPYPYPTNVGDSPFDPAIDDPSFTLCNETFVPQYYMIGTRYEGERKAIKNHFFNNYKAVSDKLSGYITIRFIVNCLGQSDRFRLFQLDRNYQPAVFPVAVTEQLLQLSRKLDKWITGSYKDKVRDSYVYLTFKIENGALKDIRP